MTDINWLISSNTHSLNRTSRWSLRLRPMSNSLKRQYLCQVICCINDSKQSLSALSGIFSEPARILSWWICIGIGSPSGGSAQLRCYKSLSVLCHLTHPSAGSSLHTNLQVFHRKGEEELNGVSVKQSAKTIHVGWNVQTVWDILMRWLHSGRHVWSW